MSVIVQKYGGSSVADIEKLRSVADKVVAARRAGNDVVVTVSAMGKTTDNLLSLAKQAATVDGKEAEPPRREIDMLVSTGERVSMALLAIAIGARGEQAISFTGSQSGIITNDRHFDARIIEVRPHRIEDELARGKVVIVAGYQGMSYKREITTLGRGGTDTTAVALAAALSAERCEIYSDVDGVYSADPRVVPDAVHLPEIDPSTLQEMAECGAKVVNAQAVEWAKKAKIAIYARSTFDAWDKGDAGAAKQTIVRELGQPREGARVRAIVGEQNLVLGRIDGLATLSEVSRACAEREIPLREIAVQQGGGTFQVPLLNVPDWPRARATLEMAAGSALTLREGLAAVSVVGDSLSTTGKPLAAFLSALREVSVVPVGIAATALRMTALIEPGDMAVAQRALHARFVVDALRRAADAPIVHERACAGPPTSGDAACSKRARRATGVARRTRVQRSAVSETLSDDGGAAPPRRPAGRGPAIPSRAPRARRSRPRTRRRARLPRRSPARCPRRP